MTIQHDELIKPEEYYRLRWQCRRGMLELDELLLNFIDRYYLKLTSQEITTLEKLLAETDMILLSWFLAGILPGDEKLVEMIAKIKNCY